MVWIRRCFKVALLLSAVSLVPGCAARTKGGDESPYLLEMAAKAGSQGGEAYARGDFKVALDRFKTALKIDRSIDNRSAEIMDLVNIGRVLIVLGDYDGAAVYLNDAVSMAVQTNDAANLGSALSTLAKAAYMTGDVQAALNHLERALSVKGGERKETGAILNLKGLIYMDAGRADEASVIFKKALALNKRRKDDLERANSYRGLAEISRINGDLDTALERYRAAYEIDRGLGDPGKIALDLNSMASLHLKQGRLEEAAFLFERSYAVNLNSGRTTRALANLDSVISAYQALGDEQKALYYIEIRTNLKTPVEPGAGSTHGALNPGNQR